jgi:ADP-ribosylation factor GTPase-activating protein 2/3
LWSYQTTGICTCICIHVFQVRLTFLLNFLKVKADFNDIESKAQENDKHRDKVVEQKSFEAKEELMSPNLTYNPINIKKEEERLKHSDPQKATQLERLGMGLGSRAGPKAQTTGRSHSAAASMATVEQVRPDKARSSSKDMFGASSHTGFFDRFVKTKFYDNYFF